MSNDYDAIEIVVNKMFEFIEYIYAKIYDSDISHVVNIELGNLYTIYEEEESDEFILI